MDNPSERAYTFVYDSSRLTPGVGGQGTSQVIDYVGKGAHGVTMPVSDVVCPNRSAAKGPAVGRFVHTFEFRLSGSEEVEQSIPLPHAPASACLMAAAKAVRVSVTRSPDAQAASIGGVEVHAEVRGNQVICVARVTDFSADDLVVVQADVIVYSERVLR
jgi:hypothetical protein